MVKEEVKNEKIRIFFFKVEQRDWQIDWMWGERERGESRVMTGFWASATE